jgi:hypothetical protein
MSDKAVDGETMRMLRHDIKNQLSNINLCLENLRSELPDPTEDATFYMDTILASAAKINTLLNAAD